VKTLQLDFINCIIQKSRTFKHFLTFDACLAIKIPDMSGKNLTYDNPTICYCRSCYCRIYATAYIYTSTPVQLCWSSCRLQPLQK